MIVSSFGPNILSNLDPGLYSKHVLGSCLPLFHKGKTASTWILSIGPRLQSISSNHLFVDPLLPDMLRQIDEHPHLWVSQSFMTHSDALMLGNNTAGLQAKNSVKIAVIVGMKPLLQVFTSVCVGVLVEW